MADASPLHPDLQALLDEHLGFVQQLHASNSLAPVAATMDLAGGINGAALVIDRENSDAEPGTPDDAIRLLTERFIAAAQQGEIKASAIFFHGSYDRRSAPLPAEDEADANCVVALLDHRDGPAFAAIIHYLKDRGGTWRYAAPIFVPKKPLIFGGGA